MTGRARSGAEMTFAASLVPCEQCGSRELGKLDLHGDGELWSYATKCPKCGKQRVFSFATTGAPYEGPLLGPFELGSGPSTLISEDQFRKELAVASMSIVEDPSVLGPKEWHTSRDSLRRALTSLSELIKLVPPSDRPSLEADRARLLELAKAYGADGDRIYDLEHG